MTESSYKFQFSIIIPFYNTGDYLEETLLSVIKQHYPLKKIQIILVNDGSTDNSSEIARRYQGLYPFNIKLIEQTNSGVSASRNVGVSIAEGEIINFLDSDDKFSPNTLREVARFFERNVDVNLASVKLEYFDGRSGDHMLNWKYSEDMIIDIDAKPQYIQLSLSSSFIRASLKDKIIFDQNLKIGEDLKLATQLLLDEKKYAVLSKPVYYYRKRADNSSAMQSTRAENSADWYFKTLKLAHKYLIDLSINKFGVVHPYLQYVIMYDLQFRFQMADYGSLSSVQIAQYNRLLCDLIAVVEDDVIWDQDFSAVAYKYAAMRFKYQNNKGYLLELDRKYQQRFARKVDVKIINYSIEKGYLYLDGILNHAYIDFHTIEIFAVTNLGSFKLKLDPVPPYDKMSLGQVIRRTWGFRTSFELNELSFIRFDVAINGRRFGNVPVETDIRSKYFTHKQHLFHFKSSELSVSTLRLVSKLKLEIIHILRILKEFQIEAFLYRVLYITVKPFVKRPIWLFSDMRSTAGDNGEILFEYCLANDTQSLKYFAIDKNSVDYERLKSLGRVINYGSLRHKLLFLFADKVISSHIDRYVIDLLEDTGGFLRDLYKFDFIFLQHGIIKDDLSSWLNKFKKNMRIFITSARKEYDSIIEGDYNLTEREVKLTGLPRYDRLEYLSSKDPVKTSRTILIMPTWRKYLSLDLAETGIHTYSKYFQESDFYKFYNGLITNPKLLESLQEHNINIKLYLHPMMLSQSVDFERSEYVSLPSEVCNYSAEINGSDLLITDYSSVAFDFAYSKKPVLYTQFDYELVFNSHIYKPGYFNYKKDGFGPVARNLDKCVDLIIESINNKFQNKEIYLSRIEKFFEYEDRNNSKRVYEEIIKIS